MSCTHRIQHAVFLVEFGDIDEVARNFPVLREVFTGADIEPSIDLT